MTETSKYPAWQEGKLEFMGDQMTEEACRIERCCNVRVALVDKGLENNKIRGTFQDNSLEKVLH